MCFLYSLYVFKLNKDFSNIENFIYYIHNYIYYNLKMSTHYFSQHYNVAIFYFEIQLCLKHFYLVEKVVFPGKFKIISVPTI